MKKNTEVTGGEMVRFTIIWLWLLYLAMVGNYYGVTKIASVTGDWSNSATWGGSDVPTVED
ncbi:MAG TPA: hypothetical protein VGK10_08745, partial [Prolixibacteraceae bacterium]